MDPNQYLKNCPQPLHLHPKSLLRFQNQNDSRDHSFRHNSPRSRDKPYHNRGGRFRNRQQNSESQHSSDGSSQFNDSSSSGSMTSPYHGRFNNKRNFRGSNSQDDISQYFHPSMLEDPWVGLSQPSITRSRQEAIQSGKVQTYDYSSSDEETTLGNTQEEDDGSSSGESEEDE